MCIAGQVTVRYIEAKVRKFKKRFKDLKKQTKKSLKNKNISVEGVTEALMSLSADTNYECKLFTDSHSGVFDEACDHSALIGQLDMYMDYLSYHLLDTLVCEFGLDEVKPQMEAYKSDLQEFRMKVPLPLFSKTLKRMKVLSGFYEMIAEFKGPVGSSASVHLEAMEQFRQKYATQYHLR